MPIRLAIFDLDDTLSDHIHSCISGIIALRERFPILASRLTCIKGAKFALRRNDAHPGETPYRREGTLHD
jgi:hypothetical protein